MFTFQIVETFTSGALNLISGVRDLLLWQSGGTTMLYGATRAGGGVIAVNVNGQMVLADTQTMGSGARLPVDATLDVLTISGNSHLVVSGSVQAAVLTYRLDGSGLIGAAVKPSGSLPGVISAQTHVVLGGQTYFLASRSDEASVHLYSMAANGTSTFLQELQLSVDAQGVNISALLPVMLGGRCFVAAAAQSDDRIVLMELDQSRTLRVVSTLGAENGLGVDAPSELCTVSAYGRTYILMAAGGSSSLTLIEVKPDGAMVVADHLIDTLETRFQGVQAMETAVVDDRVFVVIGGADLGVQLLMVLPDGHLLPVASALHQPGTALDGISAITLQVRGTVLDIFVASESSGITRLQVDVGAGGQVLGGGGGNDTILGGAGADILCGDPGNDQLFGLAGNDVLCDGGGQDSLSGGAGADVFVLTSDGVTDSIVDFQTGIDRIDLSEWGRIYRLEDLQIQATATGADIRYGAERLILIAANGLPIQPGQLTRDGFIWAWHATSAVRAEDGSILGTDGADFIVGTSGSDRFIASPGLDTLVGGSGVDEVDYSAANSALRVDLVYGETNQGLAQGQALSQIENIVGAALADVLAGNGEANRILGGAGNDLLDGRQGADTLVGGEGDDLLLGSGGADLLEGGAGRDRASWATSVSGLRVDLQFAQTNSGDAAGDVLIGIEELEGSDFGDVLGGGSQGDVLIGGGGADAMDGRAGNDILHGGAGNDSLAGGLGADLLNGGEGAGDLASYWIATAGLRVSLAQPWLNTGEAAGDQFSGIEGLVGGAHNDTLTGDSQETLLYGGAGNDSLEGGAGNDRLFGDAGADVLLGGPGADHLNGGSGGHDVASYAGATAGLRIDLTYAFTNTGEAAGDSFQGIEDVLGSVHADIIGGTGQANVLNGNLGNDTIEGWAGNDILGGAGGDDVLSGGWNDDLLVGGAGADVFVFSAGHDSVLDFQDNVDTLMIRSVAWGGGSRTVAQILAPQNVTMTPDGGLVITLSATESLTLAGISDASQLLDDIILV